MEAGAIMKVVEDTFRLHCFVIYVIARDNYRKMLVVLKHLSIGARGQVLKS